MDNLTHTLIGVAVAKAGLEKKFGRGTTWILAVASNLPDIDIGLHFLGIQDVFLYRRTLTHSIVGVPIIALIASWIFCRWKKSFGFGKMLGLVLIGMGLHVLFDLMNSYGVVLFYPLSRVRLEFAWLFIIDLTIWTLLLMPLFIEHLPVFRDPNRRIRLWRTVVFLLTFYVLGCGFLRARASIFLSREADRLHLANADPYVFPEALGCHRFHGVIRDGSTFRVYQIHAFTGLTSLFQTYETVESDPRVQALLRSPRLLRLMAFFKRPVFQWRDNHHVSVFDLRFLSTVLPWRNSIFSFVFDVSPPYTSIK